MMYLEISSKLRRVRLDEKELLWCEEVFTRDSEDLSGGTRIMLDARELPEGVGEVPVEINPPVEEAIKPSGT
jgi:hypothetical protein